MTIHNPIRSRIRNQPGLHNLRAPESETIRDRVEYAVSDSMDRAFNRLDQREAHTMGQHMITLFHRTTEILAERIMARKFRDDDRLWTDYWLPSTDEIYLTDVPRLPHEGAQYGGTLLRLTLKCLPAMIESFELAEDGKPYREWCIPARRLTRLIASIKIETEDHRGINAAAVRT